MGVKRVCPYCKKHFISQKNAKVYCSVRCAKALVKRKQKKINKSKKYHLCQWCAERFIPLTCRTKFCSCSCRGNFVKAVRSRQMKNRRRPIKHPTFEVVRKSREAGLSYGVYVGIHRLD